MKERSPRFGCHAEPWTDVGQACFSISSLNIENIFLLLAGAPFTPIHRTEFSGVILIKAFPSEFKCGKLLLVNP
jgi:hypothetical protein